MDEKGFRYISLLLKNHLIWYLPLLWTNTKNPKILVTLYVSHH